MKAEWNNRFTIEGTLSNKANKTPGQTRQHVMEPGGLRARKKILLN